MNAFAALQQLSSTLMPGPGLTITTPPVPENVGTSKKPKINNETKFLRSRSNAESSNTVKIFSTTTSMRKETENSPLIVEMVQGQVSRKLPHDSWLLNWLSALSFLVVLAYLCKEVKVL